MLRHNIMPSLSNVAAGQTATLKLPLGLTYYLFQLEFSGVTLAQLKNPTFEINGKPVMSWKDGVEVDNINQHYQRGAATTVLNFWFMRPELTGKKVQLVNGRAVSISDSDLTAIGTADIATLDFRVDIDAAAAAPVLKAYAMRGQNQPLGLICKVKSFPRSFATTGTQEIDTLPRGNGARIAAIHCIKGDVSALAVVVDSINVIEGSKTVIGEAQKRFKRTPMEEDMTTVDFLLSGDILDALQLQGVADFRLKPAIDTVGEVRTVVEYLDGLDGL